MKVCPRSFRSIYTSGRLCFTILINYNDASRTLTKKETDNNRLQRVYSAADFH